jgi:hypothetical protein
MFLGGVGSGYRLPLQLTKEMKMSLDKLVVKLETPNDFPVALRVFRAGLIAHGVLDEDGLRSMYLRKKIDDAEAQFFIEKGLVNHDFRPLKKEVKRKIEDDEALNKHFAKVLDSWDELKDSSKIYHLEQAKKHSHLSYAKKLLNFVNEKFLERFDLD